jgi:hypothetical protein
LNRKERKERKGQHVLFLRKPTFFAIFALFAVKSPNRAAYGFSLMRHSRMPPEKFG